MHEGTIKPTLLRVPRSTFWSAAIPALIVAVEWVLYGLRLLVSKVSKPAADLIGRTFFSANFFLSLPDVLLHFSSGFKPNRIVSYSIAALSRASVFRLITGMKESSLKNI